MKIAVYGATGRTGTQVVLEAARRGHEVLAVSRHESEEARLVDTPEFPQSYKPEALTHAGSLDALHKLDGSVDWSYLSPAPMLVPGERTGAYGTGADSPVGGSISFADLAIAVLDELEQPAHARARWTVAAG